MSECRNRGFGVHNCQHTEDAGVLCQRKEEGGREKGREGERERGIIMQ